MELKYGNVALSESMMTYLINTAKELKVPVSYLIVKLHFEGLWGTSTTGKEDNNLSGMSMPESEWSLPQVTRPSGVVVTRGIARPAHETGYYYHYKTIQDFLTDWTYLIRRGGIYKVADSATFADAVKGMFVYGEAKADYATMDLPNGQSQKRFELYLKGMEARRRDINNVNNGILDVLDKGEDVSMSVTAQKLLDVARKYIGITKGSTAHKALVDRYNKVLPRPVGYAVTYQDDWCDTYVSAISDEAGATSLIGRECGVERHKSIFKQKNIWKGLVKPKAGDIVIFRWDGNRNGFAHHIGFVEAVSGNNITTIEGNTTKNGVSCVGRNIFAWNNANIQGYARPNYSIVNGGSSPIVSTPEEKKVSQHFVVTIDNLRAFHNPSSAGSVVENIKKDLVKNIDVTVIAAGYLWGGWISSVDGKRRWTTLQTVDGKRKFVDIKSGTISHGGKTYSEWLDTQKVSTPAPKQPVGGEEPKIQDGEFTIDGVVYKISKK